MQILIFGLGYSARFFADRFMASDVRITGTVRTQEKIDRLHHSQTSLRRFNGTGFDDVLIRDIKSANACLVSIPPDAQGDPVLRSFYNALAQASHLKWIGYLSTVGVYGNHNGAWVNEETPCNPMSIRSHQRLKAEQAWLDFADTTEKTVHILRLSGIYGPNKNALINLKNGTARRIIKPDQVFNRIHVKDIAGAAYTALHSQETTGIYNVTDDEPAPPQDVVAYAARLMNVPIPPDTPFEAAPLSDMGREFYSENKRVSNSRLKNALGYNLIYRTYREGLTALQCARD
jgi:nucleoside-diphosphate-sugar epimerase